ncbi:ribosomal RNA large subunit methyltransferase H [Alicyclobacillus cellulosilyticus]|uniref:Ribosomal RNA large subunit methyltransferase H n=1 Tax=Alicyclobacillus cellulosilyticus TaxID=1003997 RepID=A0A917JZW5_9BACL|nr:23S rRNA (pseudouridine(1915)-N(3))-methyltransferase RlmH [Alicyclobacillus cellulosilyticus]GGI95266.1 ribosomal RNA large subunit methyltransferase H [Alicyclobacillus cellulosilyticus]
MQLVVLAVGKVKERYWRQALDEYIKRLSRYAQVVEVEVPDMPAPDGAPEGVRAQALRAEADAIRKHLRERDGIVVLDRAGMMWSSEAWAGQLAQLEQAGFGRLVFVVGGSYGVAPDLLAQAHLRWSFGPITLPHNLARVVLLEQLYRAYRILRGEPYHK